MNTTLPAFCPQDDLQKALADRARVLSPAPDVRSSGAAVNAAGSTGAGGGGESPRRSAGGGGGGLAAQRRVAELEAQVSRHRVALKEKDRQIEVRPRGVAGFMWRWCTLQHVALR